MFDDALDRKEGFLDHKNFILTKQKNKHFSSGVKTWFGQKYEICSDFFFSKKTLDMTLHDVLERKEGFLDYKHIRKIWSSPTILVKIEISSESVLLWKRLRYVAIKLFFSLYKKGLDEMFDDDLDYKNDILTSWKKLAFFQKG